MLFFLSKIKNSQNSPLNNERGIALVLTMSMLVILTLLGIMVLNSTDTELSITSNYRVASDAFVAAELASEYASQRVVNDQVTISDLSTESALTAALPDGVDIDGTARNEVISYTGMIPSAMMETTSTDAYQNNIFRTGETEDASGEAAYYRIAVQTNARGRSSARIEKLFVHRGGHVY